MRVYNNSIYQTIVFILQVIDVSREKLTAAVKVLKPVGNMLKEDQQLIEEVKNKVVSHLDIQRQAWVVYKVLRYDQFDQHSYRGFDTA